MKTPEWAQRTEFAAHAETQGRQARANGCGVEANPYFEEDGNVLPEWREHADRWKAGHCAGLNQATSD